MLNFSFSIHALVVVFLASWAFGHSESARPLKRLAHPSTLSIDILPRNSNHKRTLSSRSTTLRHDDSFRLIISAFDEDFYIHLRPNDHLVHPAARINYHTTSDDGSSVTRETVPLLRESVRAYWGEVVRGEYTDARMREDAAKLYRPETDNRAELGWARIMVHHQGSATERPSFEGAFTVNGVIHHVMTREKYLRTKHQLDPELVEEIEDGNLVIWRESDVMTHEEEHLVKTGALPTEAIKKPQSCGHDRLSYNTDPLQNPLLRKTNPPVSKYSWPFGNLSLGRRDDVVGSGMNYNFGNTIGNIDGCPKTQKILYMGVAADCKYVETYGSKEAATTQILNDWNSASALYKSTFNVSLGIIELQIEDRNCPSVTNDSAPWNTGCSTQVTLNDRLSIFSDWRGDKGDDGVGLWHLMSGCPTGTEVGIAWLATLCQQSASGSPGSIVSGTAVSTAGRTEWQVVAHETGHNFGAIHDCSDGCTNSTSCCPMSTSSCNANSQFLMSPVSSDGETAFSPCTIGNICSVMTGVDGSQTDTSCLVDPESNSRQLISLSMCGNGIVEDGEQCDPGLNMTSSCCDATTCKFRDNAVCDPQSSPCCTDQCSFAPSSQVCRPSKDSRCDQAETCSGNSSSCPTDIVSPNGQSCGDNDLACASGECTSVSLQCQTVGASMGLQEACPNRGDNSCRISCQDPTQSNACVLLSAGLIDGSPCGYGGTCFSGSCQSGSALDTVKSWYTQNLQIAIPVTIVAGLVALAILWCLVRSILNCCRGGRTRPMVATRTTVIPPVGTFSGMRHARLQSYDRNGAPPPQNQHHPSRSQSQSQSHWVDAAAYNGRGYNPS